MSRLTVEETAKWLLERDGFLILTHVRPDGDTVGCAAGPFGSGARPPGCCPTRS